MNAGVISGGRFRDGASSGTASAGPHTASAMPLTAATLPVDSAIERQASHDACGRTSWEKHVGPGSLPAPR
jgi:hypothetical protein